jgi:hypothetical protein
MKQQIIELKKRLLLVELPKGYVVVSVFPSKRTLTMWNENGQYITEKLDFDVDEIGKLTDITDNQCEEWVESYTSLENRFRNYTAPAYIEFLMKTAKESFFSYLESRGVVFENPLGEKPVLDKESLWGNPEQDTQVFAALNYQMDKWQEAQQKVWDINRCWGFEIL